MVNEQSEYADNEEKQRSIQEICEAAGEHRWRMFGYRIPYSRSYPEAARRALPLSRTSNARWDRIDGFDRLKNEIFETLHVRKAVP